MWKENARGRMLRLWLRSAQGKPGQGVKHNQPEVYLSMEKIGDGRKTLLNQYRSFQALYPVS